MSTTIEEIFKPEIEHIKVSTEELEKATSYTLADAIRGGSEVTEQEFGWGSEGRACAMTAAAVHIMAMKDK
jgi:hypothetical protein